MNGRERLLTVLNGERADRVPVTLFIQGQGHFITQVNPETDPWDFIAIQKNVIDYQKSLGLDVHARMLFFNPHKPVFCPSGVYECGCADRKLGSETLGGEQW